MPSFWKSNRSSKSGNTFTDFQHPDLPLPRNSRSGTPIQRSTSVSERQSASQQSLDNRRSIAVLPSAAANYADYSSASDPAYAFADELSPAQSTLGRAQTVARRDGAHSQDRSASPVFEVPAHGSPSSLWSPDFAHLPAPSEQQEVLRAKQASMNPSSSSKTSSDSGQNAALDRWSQRRLQRLNTEQGFREQRQGGGAPLLSPTGESAYNSNSNPYPLPDAQPQYQTQPHPSPAYQAGRVNPATHSNAGPTLHSQPAPSRSPSYPAHEQPQVAHMQSQHQYSPSESIPQYQTSDTHRPHLQQTHSYSRQQLADDQQSMASSNNGNASAPKAVRSAPGNRQSVHNGLMSREGSNLNPQQGMPSFNASVVPPASQGQPYRAEQSQQQVPQDARRTTPQPTPVSDEEQDVAQLVKDHKELREKYTKVKKYYFEKEDQVKQLQNSLAHQKLSQSRTSLDDSEYTTRFNRLDGLVAQLAFSIRKSWKSIPSWLVNSVNKDAVATGKQEMTAAGRAFISCWLVEEVFDKHFHPDLEPTLSTMLKSIQKNIRRFAPPCQSAEEEDYLTAKTVNWRLSTLEGLQEALRSPTCSQNRTALTDTLKEGLINALSVHLQDPPPSDLEGGVHMIVELVVSIAIHLPLESRDVTIEYFMPGFSIMPEQMKLESGIPPLVTSVADDAADRASLKSAASDMTDNTDSGVSPGEGHAPPEQRKKRSMLSAFTGSERKGKSNATAGKHATGSSGSLHRPESSQGIKDDAPPRVRMAAGFGVTVRGRTVLVKAPVFGT